MRISPTWEQDLLLESTTYAFCDLAHGTDIEEMLKLLNTPLGRSYRGDGHAKVSTLQFGRNDILLKLAPAHVDPEQPGMFAMVRRVRSNKEILGLREERQHHLQELTQLAVENATLKAEQLIHRAQISMLETKLINFW